MKSTLLKAEYYPLAASALLFVLFFVLGAIQFPGFASLRVVLNLFTDNAFLLICALGMTFVILAGKIDLSVGSMIALTGVVSATLIEKLQWSPLLVFPVILLGALCFGAVMGALVHYYRIQAFIVTLAGMFFARGLATVISEESLAINHEFYSWVNNLGVSLPGRAWLGIVPVLTVVVIIAAVVLAQRSRFGRYVYALGGNEQSADLMGVPVARTTIAIFALSSGMAALAGIVFSFYTSSGYALAAMGAELDAIAAVVIGGTLLTGGRGYVLGTVIGVLLMGLIQTYISFHGGLNSWWTKIVIGVLVLTFIAIQQLVSRQQRGTQ